jgi:hypothetical protein
MNKKKRVEKVETIKDERGEPSAVVYGGKGVKRVSDRHLEIKMEMKGIPKERGISCGSQLASLFRPLSVPLHHNQKRSNE